MKFFKFGIRRKLRSFSHKKLLLLSKKYREKCLKTYYFNNIGQPLDLKNPKTFNEKMQWLKLYDSTSLKTKLADKYLVRHYVEEKIGSKYLIPLLGCWKKFDEIDFDKLPNKFVLKCNHGCGYNIIVKDKSKLDIDEARKKINKWMSEDFSLNSFEFHYSKICRRIIAEEYIDPSVSSVELQGWCFNGKIKFVSYETVKNTKTPCRCIFNKNWEPVNFKISPNHYNSFTTIPQKPDCYEEFLNVAEILAKNFYHVRIDFIICNGKLLFREMTFTSASGFSTFEPKDTALLIGDMLKLPCDNKS